jgi:phospholipid transport system transporter-binding protein
MNGSDASITLQNDRLMVSGDLNFATVMKVWNQSLPLLMKRESFYFDFSNVISTNSAGLALMIEWIKYARSTHKNIEFNYLPPQLMSIASVSGIAGMLSA